MTYICVKRLLEKKSRVGHDFVFGNLIGWLWYVIGGSHLSDRLHHQRRYGGRGSYFEDYKAHEFKDVMCMDK